jgi:ElaB/YqjD/DUF883 family membrane-anchored ribosome-binding protein
MSHASALAHRGVEALHDGSRGLRAQAHRASVGTNRYIQQEPVKAVLIAAATGAMLMALIGFVARSRHNA